MKTLYKDEVFTSQLEVLSNSSLKSPIPVMIMIEELTKYDKFQNTFSLFDDKVTNFISKISIIENIPTNVIKDFVCYDYPSVDFTGLLKGYGIAYLHYMLIQLGSKDHVINWGGDMIGYNVSNDVKIKGPDTTHTLSGNFTCFTSGNDGRRGRHIKSKEGKSREHSTVINYRRILPITADILATSDVSNGCENIPSELMNSFSFINSRKIITE